MGPLSPTETHLLHYYTPSFENEKSNIGRSYKLQRLVHQLPMNPWLKYLMKKRINLNHYNVQFLFSLHWLLIIIHLKMWKNPFHKETPIWIPLPLYEKWPSLAPVSLVEALPSDDKVFLGPYVHHQADRWEFGPYAVLVERTVWVHRLTVKNYSYFRWPFKLNGSVLSQRLCTVVYITRRLRLVTTKLI